MISEKLQDEQTCNMTQGSFYTYKTIIYEKIYDRTELLTV